ncbi:M56 family metallopeptidase [Pedobacter ginsengisoli]|uniref:M56 family metallopeptidase n=1 Tax=Pedobacter ginsengisoli TaxID=363852 RepID=UPI00254FF828|nr:M56 family metallopeptidase [Pedobacter ginsengisoli]
MNALIYILQVNLYLLLFYLFYVVLLRNETFFKTNRFYLVGSALLSLCIPFVKAKWVSALFITEKVQNFTEIVTYRAIEPTVTQINIPSLTVQEQVMFSPMEWLLVIYLSVSLVLLLNFLRKLYIVRKLLAAKVSGQAFSFFGKISVDQDLEGKDTIISHELVHARQWHSADVIFFELFLAMNWFNPIAYFYRNAIKNIHEFIADDSAASTLEDRSAYALLLVSSVFNTQPQRLTNNFFNQSLLKRRIIMLHKTKSRKIAILKYGLSVPLFAGMIIFSSATGADAKIVNEITKKAVPVIARISNIDLNPIKNAVRHTEPLPKSKKVKKKTIAAVHKKSKPDQYPENLVDYAFNFKEKGSITDFKEGLILISFEVKEDKKPGNFKITKSDNFNWQDDYLAYMNNFNDTVAMQKGTYHFYKGFILAGNEDKYPDDKTLKNGSPKMVFGSYIKRMPSFVTAEEESGKIGNYITETPLIDPVIVIDGKQATYTKAKSGYKLDEVVYPRNLKTIRIFMGDEAVAKHNETARKGLIMITTKEPGQPKE